MFASFFAAPPISWSSISIPYSKAGSVPLPEHLQAFIPKSLWEIVGRATTAYIAVGPETAIIQTVATLEVLHAALGWVRSPITTTAMQVSSRLFLVWGVTELSEVVCSSAFHYGCCFIPLLMIFFLPFSPLPQFG